LCVGLLIDDPRWREPARDMAHNAHGEIDLMSPAYWVYLVMAVTILFNALKAISRFRLWRVDAARQRLERRLKEFTDPALTHAQIRLSRGGHLLAGPATCAAAQGLRDQENAGCPTEPRPEWLHASLHSMRRQAACEIPRSRAYYPANPRDAHHLGSRRRNPRPGAREHRAPARLRVRS
jgi:hypothetical protein